MMDLATFWVYWNMGYCSNSQALPCMLFGNNYAEKKSTGQIWPQNFCQEFFLFFCTDDIMSHLTFTFCRSIVLPLCKTLSDHICSSRPKLFFNRTSSALGVYWLWRFPILLPFKAEHWFSEFSTKGVNDSGLLLL